jgi:hypothetical protein
VTRHHRETAADFGAGSLARHVLGGSTMRAIVLSSFVLALHLAACGSQIVDPSCGDDCEENGSGAFQTDPSDPSGPGGTIAVAMSRARSDALWDEYWASHDEGGSSGSSGGGDELNPADLFLKISDMGTSCQAAHTDLPCGSHWSANIVLPPALQSVGVYDLEDPSLVHYSSISETGPGDASDPDSCWWGGGSLGSGSIEILSIDAREVRFRLALTNGLADADPSGEYVAPRCD